jgi:hypothetical protein
MSITLAAHEMRNEVPFVKLNLVLQRECSQRK